MSKCISEITIKNIKGLEDWTYRFNGLVPNKINLMVAANGFGKSSITTAFEVSSHGAIKIDKKYLHEMDENRKPSLRIDYYDENKLNTVCCDEQCGELSKKFYIETIDSPIYAKSTGRSTGRYSIYSAAMRVRDIEVCDVPQKQIISYSYKEVKEMLGKDMPNLSKWFSSEVALRFIINNKKQIEKCLKLKKSSSIIDGIFENHNSLIGIEDDENISCLITDICEYGIVDNKDDAIKYFIQIMYVIKTNTYNNIKHAYEWASYQKLSKKINERILEFNTTGLKLKTKKAGRKLVIEFGDATRMSNGERDVLSFIVSLAVFENNLKHNKPGILVIDEVFDYLDGANMIAAQYYLSKMIETIKAEGKESYIIMMTHLDPAVFGNYYFRKMAVHYLDTNGNIDLSDELVRFLMLRTSLKEEKRDIAEYIEKYFLHFNHECREITEDIRNNLPDISWEDNTSFRKFLYSEVEKYINGIKNYNALAIVIGLRIRVEERIFNMLPLEAHEKFYKEHGAKNKLQLAEKYLRDLPELFYLLQPLYNDSAHLRKNEDNVNLNKIKSAYLKTQSKVIKKMISEVFNAN